MRWLLLLSIAVLGHSAWADKDRGLFVGAGVSLVNVGVEDPFSNEVTFKVGELQAGYKYNALLGVDARFGTALQTENLAVDDAETGLRDSVDADIDYFYSLYYRAELANEIAKLYVLIGQSYVATTLDFEESGMLPIETTDSGLSYGLGFGLWLDERMNLNFEFRNLVSTENDNFLSGGITADYRF